MGARLRSGLATALACALVMSIAAPVGVGADPSPDRDGLPAVASGLGALAAAPALGERLPPSPRRHVTEGVIHRGKTLSESLRAQGVSPQVVNQIAKGLTGHFNFRHAQPGHGYRLVQDGEGGIVEFRYRTSVTDGFTLTRDGDRFDVSLDETQLEPRNTRIAGIITSTLYQSITNLGEEGQLARDFSDVFAWDIDFQREVQPGDAYQILYERLYRTVGGRDVYVRPGRILAARFQGRSGDHTAVYFEPGTGKGGYYRGDGSSVEGMFLMAPMRHGRITSNYNPARRHPILKVTRPHRGIDYAASTGTPVWSVANGTVIYRGWQGGNGNFVQIRHDNGYVSSYAHLSRFAKGLAVGARVGQKQVIGYVGQTGLATGPHVCFRIQQDGKYVDPARLRMPSGAPIPGALVPTFRAHRDQLLTELSGSRKVAENR
jgi:murein DD-endopeptidase MepM/ murein hydrolase activator NlpD